MAALSAHPSLKHCVAVDTDVNIFDAEDVEYAIATRVKGDRDIMIVPNVRGSSLDPVAESDGTTTKIGVDVQPLKSELMQPNHLKHWKNSKELVLESKLTS